MGISHSEERRTLEDHQSGRTAKCIWRAGPANENEEAYDTGGLGGEGADHGRYPGTGRHKPHRKWEPHGAGLRAARPGGGAGRHLGLVDGRGRKIIMP